MLTSSYTWRQKRILAFIAILWILLGFAGFGKMSQEWFVGGVPSGTRVISANLSTATVSQAVVISVKGSDMVGYKPYSALDAALPGIQRHGLALPMLANMPAGLTLLLVAVGLGALGALSGSAVLSAVALLAVYLATGQSTSAILSLQGSWITGENMTSTGSSSSFLAILSLSLALGFSCLILTGFVKGRELAKNASHALSSLTLQAESGKLSISTNGRGTKTS